MTIGWRHQAITWSNDGKDDIDGPMQNCSNSIANALELLQSCIEPSIYTCIRNQYVLALTHWGRVTLICVSNLIIIGLDNGLMPGWDQAIILTNAGILLIGPLGTNFNEILSEIPAFSFQTRQHSTQSVRNMPPPSPRHLLPHVLQIMPRNANYDQFQPKGHHNEENPQSMTKMPGNPKFYLFH